MVSSWAIKHVDIQKLAGLWFTGEVATHVGTYGYKVAEGFSMFQRRSFYTGDGLIAVVGKFPYSCCFTESVFEE